MSFIDAKNNDSILKILDKHENVILYFTAPWCAACDAISEKIYKIPLTFPNVKCMRVDYNKCKKFCDICLVEALPTFIVFNKGQEVNRFVGTDVEGFIGQCAVNF